jgi:hypothetical protein
MYLALPVQDGIQILPLNPCRLIMPCLKFTPYLPQVVTQYAFPRVKLKIGN